MRQKDCESLFASQSCAFIRFNSGILLLCALPFMCSRLWTYALLNIYLVLRLVVRQLQIGSDFTFRSQCAFAFKTTTTKKPAAHIVPKTSSHKSCNRARTHTQTVTHLITDCMHNVLDECYARDTACFSSNTRVLDTCASRNRSKMNGSEWPSQSSRLHLYVRTTRLLRPRILHFTHIYFIFIYFRW